jgi:CubicO group peptidase (beta-lactamase class C family)
VTRSALTSTKANFIFLLSTNNIFFMKAFHMKRSLHHSLFLISYSLFSIFSSGQTPSFISDSLDSYIQHGMKQWQIPGLAIVIVKDGKIIVKKGYGTTAVNEVRPVDENTLFFIASNTKLFTGTALAHLENLGKLSLNDTITKYFPDYKLYDKTSTSLVTIKDMLCHRIGTKTFQGDFTFWNSNLSRGEIMRRMQYLKPINPFRQDYGYCNSCFMTAGQIIPKVTGREWEDFITDSLLKPLSMNNSYAVSNGIEKRQINIAKPYTTSFTGILREVPYDRWDNLGPAAAIVSNVNDLSHWLMFQLDSGRYNGKQIMPWKVLQKTRDVNIITSSRKSSLYPVHFRGYGLGLFAADYNGKQVYWHTGGAAGMVSNICFVPEEKLGIAILTNNDNQNFFECLRYQVLDAYLHMPYINRSLQQLDGFNHEMDKQLAEIQKWRTIIAEEIKNGPDTVSVPNNPYAGNYTNQLYGTITITKINNFSYSVKFNSHPDLTATLKSLGGGQDWLLEYNNIEYGIFKTSFKIVKGNAVSIEIKANDFVESDAYLFVKDPSGITIK